MNTERLTLRALTLADAPRIAALAGDIGVARMTARIPHPYPLTSAHQWIAGIRDGDFIRAIVLDGTLIGVCGYERSNEETAEIGYWLGRDWWGQGFATEAMRAVVRHCFHEARFKKLTCCHFDDNEASKRVIEKLGFHRMGTCRVWCEARGAETPSVHYALRRPIMAWLRSGSAA